MELTPMEVYWLFQMDSIKEVFISATVFLTIALIANTIVRAKGIDLAYSDEKEGRLAALWKSNKTILAFLVPVLIMATFIPSTKTLAAMYVVPVVVNNKDVQKIPTKVLDLVNQKLDELAKE